MSASQMVTDTEFGPKPVRDMSPAERAVVQEKMDALVKSGLIKFAGPIDRRNWRVVGPTAGTIVTIVTDTKTK